LSPFAALADLLPEPMLLVGAGGQVEAANQAAVHLLGRAPERLAGMPLRDLVREEHAVVADLLKAGSRTPSIVPGKLTVATNDGNSIPCRCEAALYQQGSAAAPALVLLRLLRKDAASSRFVLLTQRIDELSREISRRLSAEALLRETTTRYRVTLESIGDAVIATDARGDVTFMNPVAEQLTGWPADRAIGAHLDQVFVIRNEDTRQPVESPVSKVLRLGGIIGLANHTILVRADGTELPIDDSGAPIRDHRGAVVGVVLVFRDLSERHAYERQLTLKTQQLEEADRRKDEFLSMLAHELRNPIAPLSNGVQLLKAQHGSNPAIQRLAQMMERQVTHMVRLVDDLLDVARLTRGTVELRRRPVALAQAIDQALETINHAIESQGLILLVDRPPGHIQTNADLTRLVQVFANLLSNAAKFSTPGGTVHVGWRLGTGHAAVFVSDNGMGIDPQLLPHVFDVFVQGDRTLDRSRSGLGIGLTIAQSIVQMHGGTIEATSAGPGLGSAFTVRLPLVSAADAAGAGTPASNQPAQPLKLRVLVVDDNQDAAQTLCSILEGWGLESCVAYDARSALDLVGTFRPDCVLLDIGLPGMNGYEVAQAIRLLPHDKRRILLIAVTGYGDASARERSLASGFDHHLTKPVDLELLRPMLS
jgi:PAS domain S-box-containing protein